MKMTELEFDGAQPPIDGYAPGGFRIAGRFHEGSVLIAPAGLASWPAAELGALDAAAAAPLAALAGSVDVLLLGAGPELARPPAAFAQPIEAAGLFLEPMASPTACRLYNVLLSEGRRVAAALIALPSAA